MKKTILILVLASLLSACTKNLTSLNVDPKHPATVPSYTLFTEAERLMANYIITPDVNDNTFRLIEQQWTETQYITETQYDIKDRLIPDNIYSGFYTGALINFEKAKQFMATDVADAGTRKNEIAISDICEVYSFYYLVTTFGNIPYTQAFDTTKPFPVFDDAATIYADLFKRLDADIAALDPSSGSIGSADQIYAGDPGQWLKFANTLKVKLGVTVSGSSNTTLTGLAKTAVESAVKSGNLFASNSDNAEFIYLAGPPSTNPIWVQLVQSGRYDYVATDFIMGLLGAQNTATPVDARVPYFFAPATSGTNAGNYIGAPVANVVVASHFSLPSGPLYTAGSVGSLTNPDYPGDILDYSELQFNLAEAAARGYSVGGSAATFFKNAVDASFQFWTGSTTGAAAYDVLPAVTGAAELTAIAQQEYLSLYNRGWDAWTMTRRLNYPVFTPPPGAFSGFPVRFTYPIVEQNTNPINYKAASAAIGGDEVTTELVFFK